MELKQLTAHIVKPNVMWENACEMPWSIFHMISGWFRFQPGSKRVDCHSNLLWTSPLYLAQSSTSCNLSCLQGPSKRASRYKSLQTIVLDQGFSNECSAREPSVSPKDLSPPLSKMVVCFYAFNCIRRHGAPEQYSLCLHMTTLSTSKIQGFKLSRLQKICHPTERDGYLLLRP